MLYVLHNLTGIPDYIRCGPLKQVTASEKVRLPFNDWANMDEPQLR